MAEVEASAVIDDVTYRMAEVGGAYSRQTGRYGGLEGRIPIATRTGRGVLHNLVLYGAGERSDILARQEAVEELGEKPELHEVLSKKLQAFGQNEGQLYDFRKREQASLNHYIGASWAAKRLLQLCQSVEELGDNRPESTYLREHLQAVDEFNQTNLAGMLRGPIYYTGRGLRSKDKLAKYEPRLRFRSLFSGRLLVLAGASFIPVEFGMIPGEALVPIVMMGAWGGMMCHMPFPPDGTTVKDTALNRPTVYNPLRKRIEKSTEYEPALASVGNLDIAVALNEIRKAISDNGHSTVLPEIETEDVFHFRASGLRNPMLALNEGRQVVANNLEFGGANNRLTFLTGPNSGGKSTLSKAVIQNLVLGQIGGVMVAETASITPADRIAYHVPMPPDLEEETGRLGFELGRVRKILDNTTLHSLTALDDCLDGTTHEERVQILKSVMFGFRYLGGATLFSTHAHELVGDFEAQDEGQFLQVEFQDEAPTYRVIPGVSHTSHAANVAKNYGFTADQVQAEIESHGISANWF